MIRSVNIHKIFTQGKNKVTALAGVSFDVEKGKFAVIMGASGSGKSTLLHLIGGLDRPSQGEILVDGRIISQMPDDEVTLFRRTQVGFVFQFFNLLPTLSAVENVMLPLVLDGQSTGPARARAQALLERVGLEARKSHLPEEMSGGEMQRLAIARAVAFHPQILLADEPTGNLDSKSGGAILRLIRDINEQEDCTVIMVTHNREAADYGDRIIYLKDGVIEKESQ